MRKATLVARACFVFAVVATIAGAAACAESNASPEAKLLSGVELSKPSWAPSSTRLVADSSEPHGVSVVSVEGADARSISDIATFNEPAWSPTGESVLVTDHRQPRRLLLLDPMDGSAPTVLVEKTPGAMRTWLTSWHPDGKEFLFLDGDRLFVYSVVTGEARAAKVSGGVASARWTADGHALLVQRGLEVTRETVAAGEGPEVEFGVARLFQGSPDGHVWTLALARNDEDRSDHRLRQFDSEGALVSEWDFGERVTGFDVGPISGRVAVAIAGVGIEILDPVTGQRVQLTDGRFDQVPSWSPDESRLAFLRQHYRRGEADLFVAAVPAGGG